MNTQSTSQLYNIYKTDKIITDNNNNKQPKNVNKIMNMESYTRKIFNIHFIYWSPLYVHPITVKLRKENVNEFSDYI